MPIAVHSSTPARVTDDGVSSISTAPFSPPAGSLLLAFFSQDTTTGNAGPSLSISNSGAALSWLGGPQRDSNDPQDFPSATKVWAAAVPTDRTNMTVTAGTNQSNEISLKVYVLTGANTSSPFGTTIEGSNEINVLVTSSLTPAYAGSLGFVSAVEGTPLTAPPTATGYTYEAFSYPSEVTGLTGYKALGGVGSTNTFTIDGAGSTAARWNWIAVEIRAGSQQVGPTGGIASAQAFGNASIQRGPVTINLNTRGIPPGSVGAARIQRPIKLTGIPSAEAVGTPVLGPGFNPVGIKSEESFGSPVVHNYGLGPIGIPSQAIIPSPTILRGAVTIHPQHGGVDNGIPSAEGFGQPKLNLRLKFQGFGIASAETFGGSRVRIVQIVPRTVPLRQLTKYELVMVGVVYNTQGQPTFTEIDPIDWSSISYSDELNAAQSLSAGCNIQKLSPALIQRLQNLEDLPTELLLRRNGVTVFTGPLLGGNVSQENISFEAKGILSYLDCMWVASDLAYNTDQFTIVRNLIDQWQSGDYGNFGINTANVGVSGVTREVSYKVNEGHKVSDRVRDLSQGLNGFDYDIDPTTRELRLYYPFHGIDRSQGEDSINFDNTNVTSADITFSVAPNDVATEAIGASNNNEGASFTSILSNNELKAKRGRVGVFGSFESDSQATLDSQTQGLLNSRGRVFMVPGGATRVTKEVDIGKYSIGDTVAYELNKRLQVRGAFRLRKRTVSVISTGTESADFEFV